MENSRRNFIKNTTIGTAALTVGGVLPGFSARSYSRIIGANNKILVSMMGVNSRGKALASNFARQENCDVAHICDVDSRAITNCMEAIKDKQTLVPQGFGDFRKSLESNDIDALVIAAPDHWHAPA
jgi:predicted dehydrogenase